MLASLPAVITMSWSRPAVAAATRCPNGGMTPLHSFALDGANWTACEDLQRPDGAIALVSTSATELFPKTYSVYGSAHDDDHYLNYTKAQAVASNVDRHVTETFRSIHSALKLSDQSKNAKIILTTSTVPGEGKSFVSSNLSLTFANHGEKTLLLDCDLRLPNVARSLQIENEIGLLDYVENGVSLDEGIVKEVYPNLDVLSTGGKSKNPTQVLNSSQFETMFAVLRDRYDRIVVDSPPLAAVSDALNLLPLVDGIIYVIKFNTVKRKTAVLNVRRLWESNTPVYGAILNNITSTLSSYYYSNYTDKAYQDYYINQEEDLDEELVGDIETELESKS